MRNLKVAIVGLVSFIAILALVVIGIISYEKSHAFYLTAGKSVSLTSGTGPNGQGWQLVAQVEYKHHFHGDHTRLCLNLMVANQQTGGSCEFDARPSYGYWTAGQGPGSSTFLLGPVPSAAVKVRLAGPGLKTYVVQTAPLPRMDGIPAGRYFIVDADPDGSVSARTDGRYWSVTAFDSSGRPVPLIDF